MSSKASLFRRFTDAKVYGTGSVKEIKKLATKYPWISVDIRIFFAVYGSHV